MDLRLTVDELHVLLGLVQHEVVSPEFAACWARERRDGLLARRIACWPPQHADRIRELLESMAALDGARAAAARWLPESRFAEWSAAGI